MAATALIKFTQGILVGADGEALVGTTGTAVNVANVDNTGVNSWQIDLVYTPSGSAVPVSVPLAFNDSSGTPAASFTPDVTGAYRVVLTVWDTTGRTGTNDADIRNFLVPEANHPFIIPPYQEDPQPKPTLASGHPGAKPNETNIGGTELGWLGDGTEGLLGNFMKSVAASNFDAVPSIGAARPQSVLAVTGSTGSVSIWGANQVVEDGTNVILTGILVATFARTPMSGVGVVDVAIQQAGIKTTWFDAIYTGSQVFGAGYDGNFSNAVIQEITSSPSMTLGTIYVAEAGSSSAGISYDGTYLYLVTANNNILTYNPSDISAALSSTPSGASTSTIRIDTNGSNYDGFGRMFIADPAGGNVNRFTLGLTPTLDVSTAFGANIHAIAIGSGTFNGKFFSANGQNIGSIDVDLVSSPVINIQPFWSDVNSIDYDTVNEKLWITAESPASNIIVARVDPTTLAVESLVELSTDSLNPGYALSVPTARIQFYNGVVWVCNTRYAAAPPISKSDFWHIDKTSGSLRMSGTNGSTAATSTFTDLTVNFSGLGVVPGDLLIQNTDSVVYYIDTVGTTTLTVTGTFGTNSGISYSIFQPLTKTSFPTAGSKSLAFVNQEWTDFDVPYLGISGPLDLGDGILSGRYRLVGDTMEVNVGFERGASTVTDPSGVLLPLPPNFQPDLDKVPNEFGLEGFQVVIIGDALSVNGSVYNALIVPMGILLQVDLSVLPVGDPSTIQYKFPIILT
jgi:hypothetical protein